MKKMLLSLTAVTFIAGSLVGCGTAGVDGQNVNVQRQDSPTQLDRGATPGTHDPIMRRTEPYTQQSRHPITPQAHNQDLGRTGIEGQTTGTTGTRMGQEDQSSMRERQQGLRLGTAGGFR
ncbi:hypothetical protein [Bacillus sp. FJAT-45350]|uniref:hypothetical protein n=1 Tax=Bacillus sp. FJAT-45350 TaxID=2011014 RepID=UPI000BB9A692|nr:hypothetical protein [Bacillus sp. FJAT-45350]